MFKSHIAKAGLVAMAALIAVAMPLTAAASVWGPTRELRQWVNTSTPGFDHVTFNSFTHVPDGNEQEFFDGKIWNTTPGGFLDSIPVKAGDEIKLRTYVHNNADASLNDAAHGYKGIAKDTKVKIALPTGTGKTANAVSTISWKDSDNKAGFVFDSVDVASADGQPFSLSYVPGSAYADTHTVTGMKLSDSIVTDGALIGESQPDGNVPGCFQNDMYVIVKLKVNPIPALTIQKTVGFPKQTFQELVTAKPGDRLYYKVDFKNESQTNMHKVAVRDILPAEVQLIPGTVKLYNDNFKTGTALPDNGLFSAGGQEVGDYAPGTNGYILYQVTVKDVFQGQPDKVFVNTACTRSQENPYEKCDTANVKVTGTVTPPVTPPVTTLPETGVETPLAGVAGMSGMSYAGYAYLKSKKGLKQALRNVRK